jgi:hypothetical protein
LRLSLLDDVVVVTTRGSRLPDAFTHVTRADFHPSHGLDREGLDISLVVETLKAVTRIESTCSVAGATSPVRSPRMLRTGGVVARSPRARVDG